MLYVDAQTNAIKLTRGDSAYLSVGVTNTVNNQDYVIQPDDVVRFTIRKNAKDANILLQKVLTGTSEIHLLPNDTKNLDFKKYSYDVELTTSTGDVSTVIEPSDFTVLPEVTY